jgi:cell division protein FtsB
MAAARSTAARRAPARGAGIRWDRLGRVALLLVLLGVLALYVNPALTYWSTWREAGERRDQVSALREENRELRARRDELRDPRALEREARGLGMVRPGERPFVVEGLPPG